MDVIRTERAFLKSERRNIFVERGILEMPLECATRIGLVHAAICLAGLRFAKPASQRAVHFTASCPGPQLSTHGCV
jgi:hypothetical protein